MARENQVGTIGERVRVARAAAGLSLRALAEKAEVSHTAISKYERGLDVPGSEVLIRLARALDVRIEYLLRPVQVAVSPPRFRKKSATSAKQERMVLARVQDELERYLTAESLFAADTQMRYVPPELGTGPWTSEAMESAAVKLRETWNLGLDPIDGLVWLLESRGIKIELIDACKGFDACTMWANESIPVIALRSDVPGDRQRFNLAHELAHLVMGLESDREAEKAAYRFAGAFLVPEEMARAELGEKRARITMLELDHLKKKWGLSMAGWLHRAVDLEIISQSKYVWYMKWFRREGWHLKEPGEPYPTERPSRLEGLVVRALAEELISVGRAGELLGRKFDPADLEAGIGARTPFESMCA